MMTTVRSMAPGERSLPAELRVDRSRAGTWDRLRAGMHGMGDDFSESDTSLVTEAPYYSNEFAGDGYGSTSISTPITATSSSPGNSTNWANVFGSIGNDITKTLAISQGGGVTAQGAVYGNPTAATVAAGNPLSQLGFSSAGLTASGGGSLLLIGIGLLAVVMLSGKH